MHFFRIIAVAAFVTSPLSAHSQTRSNPPLPEGRWTGAVTSRTIPDVDKDGEWQVEIALENCAGKSRVRFKKDDGTYTAGIELTSLPFIKTYLLVSSATERQDATGWVETQVWTLVDARPKGWTISQSRSVINQDMKPDDPWFTFRRLAWGSLEYDPDGCSQDKK